MMTEKLGEDKYSISPLDGRYRSSVKELAKYFSEFALMKKRIFVEASYAIELYNKGLFKPGSNEEISRLEKIRTDFTDADYEEIKQIEQKTHHDVKACEIFLREKIAPLNKGIIHFCLTSEDVNNISYALLLKEYLSECQLVQLTKLIDKLAELVGNTKTIPFPSRTHGQIASTSTAGKEIAVFVSRLLKQYESLTKFSFTGKLNGATGTFAAFNAAFPTVDWISFSELFLKKLGLVPNFLTTQIEDSDKFAEYFNITRQINNIIQDLDVDFWLYISRDLFNDKPPAGSIGSSTMPHKTNPINFENSEGNLQISSALLVLLSDKLTKSRMQRDLSDSTVKRNIGVALAHSYLAINETLKGLSRVTVNEKRCRMEVENNPAILAEPFQTILKKEGTIEDPYKLLMDSTKGKEVTLETLQNLVLNLPIREDLKKHMLELSPLNYTGEAERLCDLLLIDVKNRLVRSNS